jgi:hypothetical protein
MHNLRGNSPPHKIVITGTGRSGTTFLVRLLSAIGQPTGYTEQNWRDHYFDYSSAGLEGDPLDPASPYIVKNPELSVTLPDILARGGLAIDHAIVPVRDLDQAALSRVHIGGQAGEIPGGLVGTGDAEQQRAVLAERFHGLVHALVVHEVPHTFLEFPRFVQDVEYAYRKLAPIFPVDHDRFAAAFRALADPTKVHQYVPAAASDPAVASRHRRQLHAKKRWRRVRRAFQWTAAAGAGAAVAFLALPYRPASDVPSAAAVPSQAASSSIRPRWQSWSLIGSRYRTRDLAYQPFRQLPTPSRPLCLRLPSARTSAENDLNAALPREKTALR